MSDTEVLEKVIQKAIDGGWKPSDWTPNTEVHDGRRGWIPTIPEYYAGWKDYRLTIFDHDFAEALWGDKRTYRQDGATYDAAWIVHLQQMVIADDPIKYLKENI